MRTWTIRVLLPAIAWVILCGGCASLPDAGDPLRVGVTADYPPLVMRENGQLAGLEVELAVLLGLEMNRKVLFVPLHWRDQIDTLIEGRTDIIMSGLTVTRERQLRVAFTEPFMKNAVMGLCRQADAIRFATEQDIISFTGTIGVQPGTSADTFVSQHCRQARRIAVSDPENAVYELDRRRIDLFLHDGHAIAWLASQHEGSLAGVWIPLTTEYLAWAVRRTDTELQAQVNFLIRKWKREGRLQAMLARWFPYADRIEVPAGTSPVPPTGTEP